MQGKIIVRLLLFEQRGDTPGSMKKNSKKSRVTDQEKDERKEIKELQNTARH